MDNLYLSPEAIDIPFENMDFCLDKAREIEKYS